LVSSDGNVHEYAFDAASVPVSALDGVIDMDNAQGPDRGRHRQPLSAVDEIAGRFSFSGLKHE
jgi:hypothetical protein